MEFGENGAVIQPNETLAGTYQRALSTHGYDDGPRPIARLYELMKLALIFYIVAELISSAMYFAFFAFYDALPSDVVNVFEVESNISWLAELIYFTGALVAFFFACRFIYRAMRNLHTIQSPAAKTSPFWSVAYYFIPIANLFMPAIAMSRIYHGTHEAVGESSRHSSPIPLWWVPWLLTGVPEYMVDSTSSTGLGAAMLYALSGAMSIFAALMLIRIGKRIAERQELLKHGGVATVFD